MTRFTSTSWVSARSSRFSDSKSGRAVVPDQETARNATTGQAEQRGSLSFLACGAALSTGRPGVRVRLWWLTCTAEVQDRVYLYKPRVAGVGKRPAQTPTMC
jgi:hypothetical protein